MRAQETLASWPAFLPIFAGLLIILINGFFVAVEFALVTVRRGHMENLAQGGNSGAAKVAELLKDQDRAIAGTQVGITMSSILLGIVAEEPLRALVEPLLAPLVTGVSWLPGLSAGLVSVLALLVLSFFHMVLGEQTPKTIALRYPAPTALAISRPMWFFAHIAAPLVWVVDRSTSAVLALVGVHGETVSHGIHTVDELKEVVLESQEEGVISYSDQAILLRAMEFGTRYVRETMIPRTDIVAIEQSDRLSVLLDAFKVSQHSRFPVYEGDLDHVCGLVAVKDVLLALAGDPHAAERPLVESGLIKPILVVPESRHVGDLFNQMRQEHRQMAIVIDEYGGTAGLVTAEELVEEVVGRLTDEWVKEGPPVSSVGSGVFEIDAQTRVDQVNQALSLDLPASPDYETLAGFLLFLTRHIPRPGDTINYRNLRFSVMAMDGRRIARLRIERLDRGKLVAADSRPAAGQPT